MIATSEGIGFSFEFEENSETSEAEIEFEVTLQDLIEFIDENENGVYDPPVDSVASTYEIDTYNSLVYATETINNQTIHEFTIETVDGIFATTMYIAGEFVLLNDFIIAPSQIKFDIIISNYVFTEVNSSLALRIVLESEFEVDYEDDDETEDEEDGRSSDEQEVEIDYGDYTGFFSWLKNATVDGIDYEVIASPLATSSEDSTLYLNYPQGNVIIHDPKVGLEGLITGWNPPNSTIFWVELPYLTQNELLIVSAVSFITIIALVMVFRRKKIA